MKKSVYVVILAAGKSSRMKGKDKILEKLSNGREVIINTINKFDEIEVINEIVVVTREDIIDNLKGLTEKYNFKNKINIVKGGATRTQSLFSGLDFIENNFKISDDSYFIIHDGARPLIKSEDIVNCLNNAFKYKAAAVGVKVYDTIKKADKNNNIVDTVDRQGLFYIQTPQIFRRDVLNKAIKLAKEKNLDFTDDCQLVENIGEKVHIVDGNKLNIKITTNEDLILVNKILELQNSFDL